MYSKTSIGYCFEVLEYNPFKLGERDNLFVFQSILHPQSTECNLILHFLKIKIYLEFITCDFKCSQSNDTQLLSN